MNNRQSNLSKRSQRSRSRSHEPGYDEYSESDSSDEDINLDYISTNLIVDRNINVSNVILENITLNQVTDL